jgi:hypothetical protein
MGVIHVAYGASTFLATDRDFCLLEATSRRSNGALVILHRSVTHPLCKEKDAYVRGQVLFAGYVVESSPRNPRLTTVTSIMQIDARGWISDSIGETMAQEHVAKIGHLRTTMEAMYPPAQRRGIMSRFTTR